MKNLLTKLSIATTSASLAFLAVVPPVLAVNVIVPKGYALDLGKLINFILRVVMVIAALLVFSYLIWGGIEWITSGGEKSKTEGARNKITGAVVGLIILAASYAILTLVIGFLGFGSLDEVLNSAQGIND